MSKFNSFQYYSGNYSQLDGKLSIVFKRILSVLLIIAGCGNFAIVSAEPIVLNPQHLIHSLGKSSSLGIVVSQEKLASQVGASILSNGGNAVDAAVAIGFALAVTYPQAGNLGGGGFMVYYDAKNRSSHSLDFREMAPASATADMFLDAERNVDNEKIRYSGDAAGVPGTVRGLVTALNKFGTMSLKQVMRPAISLAKSGFNISEVQAYSFAKFKKRLTKFSSTRYYFLDKNANTFSAGYLWKQPDLANTLIRISRTNGDDFYTGNTAKLIVAEMQRSGGGIGFDDLKNYRVIDRKPLTTTYREHLIVSMPPPSSGGVHLIQMLNALEHWELSKLGHNSSYYLHILTEVMKQAYLDRSVYLGDSDFIRVPVQQLTDKKLGLQLHKFINSLRATPSNKYKPGLNIIKPVQYKTINSEGRETTHYNVVDKLGNVVSITYTINFSYGSGLSVTGAGFLMNNEMDDFVAKPNEPNGYNLLGSEANVIEAFKRPLSSMAPTIVFKNNEPFFVTGAPGGSRIITSVLQSILNVIDFDMNVAEAVQVPRIHHQWFPDILFYERGISLDTIEQLKLMGHNVKLATYTGRVQAIKREFGMNFGATDPRWPTGSVEFEDLK